jgi:hypothetical protein
MDPEEEARMSDHTDKFTWKTGDVEFLPGPFWSASYEQDGTLILVQTAADLVEHLNQHGRATILRLRWRHSLLRRDPS